MFKKTFFGPYANDLREHFFMCISNTTNASDLVFWSSLRRVVSDIRLEYVKYFYEFASYRREEIFQCDWTKRCTNDFLWSKMLWSIGHNNIFEVQLEWSWILCWYHFNCYFHSDFVWEILFMSSFYNLIQQNTSFLKSRVLKFLPNLPDKSKLVWFQFSCEVEWNCHIFESENDAHITKNMWGRGGLLLFYRWIRSNQISRNKVARPQ